MKNQNTEQVTVDVNCVIEGFNESLYLASNKDVYEAVKRGDFLSGWQHFVLFGYHENRPGVPQELQKATTQKDKVVPDEKNKVWREDKYFKMRLEYMKDRMCLYRPFMRPAAAEALNAAVFGETFAGSTDPSALSLLVAFCAITKPRRMLELGTYHGFGTMAISEILSTNKSPGILVTVEPRQEYQERAKEFLAQAGLTSSVHFVCGFSTDEAVLTAVGEYAPYDIIYIDSSHEYIQTLEELDLYLIKRRLIRPGGLVFLHDITLNIENDPGVGRAVDEWIKRNPEYYYLPLSTKGIWPQAAGFGIIQTPTS